jgi:hypothetical protein
VREHVARFLETTVSRIAAQMGDESFSPVFVDFFCGWSGPPQAY